MRDYAYFTLFRAFLLCFPLQSGFSQIFVLSPFSFGYMQCNTGFSGFSEVFSLLRHAFPLSTDFCVSQRIFLAFRRLACSFRCSCGYGALIAVLRLIPRYFAVLAASCAFSLYFRRISAVLRIFPIAGIYQTFSPHKSLFHADIDAFSSIRSLLSRSAALLPCTALSHAVFCFPSLLAYDCRRKTASIPFRVPL